MPIYGERGGGTFRVAGQSALGSTQTFFRVTHVRDSIDAKAGGACVLKINQNDSAAHVGLLLDEKNSKNNDCLGARMLTTFNGTEGLNEETKLARGQEREDTMRSKILLVYLFPTFSCSVNLIT